ncbi:hypothetical protein HY949_02075 [Candidatus Gottesmanbacteria bacterium]|nr:hypothetical protein [Candidatus Gottesmanbacteria bacterium]
MNTVTLTKTDFIKFNVSSTFKALAKKKAATHGMTLSELGRMLFGAFVTEVSHVNTVTPTFLAMAEEAKREHNEGKGILIQSNDELEAFLKTI